MHRMLTIRYPLYAKMHIFHSICTKYSYLVQIIFLRPNKSDALLMYTNKAVIIRINKGVLVFNMKVTIKQVMNRYEEESIIPRQITLRRTPK